MSGDLVFQPSRGGPRRHDARPRGPRDSVSLGQARRAPVTDEHDCNRGQPLQRLEGEGVRDHRKGHLPLIPHRDMPERPREQASEHNPDHLEAHGAAGVPDDVHDSRRLPGQAAGAHSKDNERAAAQVPGQ